MRGFKGCSLKPDFYNSKDFWAGMMFLGIGALAILIARGYRFGTTLRMGPGYFPSVLGGVLILFGLWIMIRGLSATEKIKGKWSTRALIVLPLSFVLFGILVERAGFIPALLVLVFGSAVAGREFKFVEILLLTVFLTLLSLAVFIWGLGLPYRLISGF